ncbi:hypothetical protein [Candidatus Frankia alpina]|uniref:hypothetical protein n=1 Tax=Candidatus Frankia alpina TaxID=2699483 RepID=UPI0013D0C4CE|nr:hypothetical protein [Candidatus Frankia alpina]
MATLVVLGLGVVLLAATAAPGKAKPLGSLSVALIALGLLPTALGCFWAGRALAGERAVLALGGLSGLAFGATALCARALEADRTVVDVVTDPLSWALLVYGAIGMIAFAAALQRGSVTLAMAGQATAETIVPAIVGLTLLGDHARSGSGGIATTGFIVTVSRRHGSPPTVASSPPCQAPRRPAPEDRTVTPASVRARPRSLRTLKVCFMTTRSTSQCRPRLLSPRSIPPLAARACPRSTPPRAPRR